MNFWDKRYGQNEYVYGEQPNDYLKEKLKDILPGTILFPAEGEGRNAVYAASLGWEGSAFDSSIEGKKKAENLAKKHHVSLEYKLEDAEDVEYELDQFDAIAFSFAHFPEKDRKRFHKKIASYLKSGGYLILQGFSKAHQVHQAENPAAGGPKDISMLYDLDELKKDFEDFKWVEAEEVETRLNEGEHHKGQAIVINLVGIKIN